jgi:hypothetical protein
MDASAPAAAAVAVAAEIAARGQHTAVVIASRPRLRKTAATDGSYQKAWEDTLGKSGKPAPQLDPSKLTNCA